MDTITFVPRALGINESHLLEALKMHRAAINQAEAIRQLYRKLFPEPLDLERLRQWANAKDTRESVVKYYCEKKGLKPADNLPVKYAEWIKLLDVKTGLLDELCQALTAYQPDSMEQYFNPASGEFELSPELEAQLQKQHTIYTRSERENQLARAFEVVAESLNELEKLGIKFNAINPANQLPNLLQDVLVKRHTQPYTGTNWIDRSIPDQYSLNPSFARFVTPQRRPYQPE
jgi:hypothetical protein